MSKIGNLFWDAVGSLQGKPKVKLVVEFNESNVTEKVVKETLAPHNVIKIEKKGVHTFRVDIRSNKDIADLITAIGKKKAVRSVYAAG